MDGRIGTNAERPTKGDSLTSDEAMFTHVSAGH